MQSATQTHEISPMWVHLASRVTRNHIHIRLLHEAHHLHVIWRLRELHSRNCAIWEDARSVTGLSAPRNHLAFDLANGLSRHRRSPQAEV